MSCVESFDGALMVAVDKERELAFAWFGGHGIHVYNDEGEEVHYFTMGAEHLDAETAEASARALIATWDEEEAANDDTD